MYSIFLVQVVFMGNTLEVKAKTKVQLKLFGMVFIGFIHCVMSL